ncbi:unnamed protein product [Amoebophrya sp. A120]|nr:unnamed protein product [Amoebophrya sp. A120]|eukprot:GSA120T00007258001.1
MPRAVFETYSQFANKQMIIWATHQEQQCLKKRGMNAHDEKVAREERHRKSKESRASKESDDRGSAIRAAIDAERASLHSEDFSSTQPSYAAETNIEYEPCPEVEKILKDRAKRKQWTLNGYHLDLNRDYFRPMDSYNKQRRLIHEWETKEPDEFRKVALTLPRGIACSSSGSLSKRRDLKLSQPEAYFPHEGAKLS